VEAIEAARNVFESDNTPEYAAKAKAELRMELADCLLLLLDSSRRAGIKPMQLFEAAQEKMKINKARTWPKPTTDEPVEHVK